jgi:hypothetical protein
VIASGQYIGVTGWPIAYRINYIGAVLARSAPKSVAEAEVATAGDQILTTVTLRIWHQGSARSVSDSRLAFPIVCTGIPMTLPNLVEIDCEIVSGSDLTRFWTAPCRDWDIPPSAVATTGAWAPSRAARRVIPPCPQG